MKIQALWLGVSAVALGAAASAAAQTAQPPSPSSSSPPSAAAEVGEVIVTAEKRSESLQSVPASISAISGQNLQQRGIENVDQLQFAVPSFRAGTLTGATDITIRGVGVGAGSAPGVAVNIDGVYQPQTFTADLAEIDLSRVEVLRGPQGTLYGRNSVGGAVNFITNAPTDAFEGSILAGYASYDEYHLQGIVNVPINDSVRTRLVVDYDDRLDGFVKNILPGGEDLDKGDTLSARFRLSADLTNTLTFDLGLVAMQQAGPFEYDTNYSKPSATALLTNPFLANATFISTPWRTNDNNPVSDNRNYESASGTFTWRLPFATLKSITAFQNYFDNPTNDGDGTNLSIAPYTQKTVDQTVTQEFDLSGTWRRLDWVGGFFYLSETDRNSLIYTFPMGLSGLPPDSYLDLEQPRYDTQSYAGFADGTLHLTKSLKLIGGVRYSEDDITATYGGEFGIFLAGQSVPLAASCATETDVLKFDSVTPRAGVQYDLSDHASVYFTYSEGYKAGGANIYSCHDDYKPESLVSYEAGIKSQWFGDRLTLNVSGFHYDYTNFQVSEIVGLALEVTNAAAATVDGVELQSAWAPDSHWTLDGNFSYINAVYTNFTNTDPLDPQLGPQDLDGHLLDNSPRYSGNAGVSYRTDMLSFGRLTARFDASYSSRVYFREFNDPLDSQAPYGLVNLNFIWDSPDLKYSARIYANNLTNQAYIQNLGASSTIGTRYISWGAPRQVGAEVKVRF